MYLDAIRKLDQLASDDEPIDFSAAQLAYIAQHPEALTGPQYLPILEKILLAVPEDKRRKLWGETFVKAAAEGNLVAVGKIISLFEETTDAELLSDTLSFIIDQGGDTVYNVAKLGDAEALIRLAKLCGQYGDFNDEYSPPSHLWWAALSGHTDTVKKLIPVLAESFPPHTLEWELEFAFSEAVPAGKTETIHALLEGMANVPNGHALISKLLRTRFADLVIETIDYEDYHHPDADPSLHDPVICDNSETALSLIKEAQTYGGPELVRELLTSEKFNDTLWKLLAVKENAAGDVYRKIVTRIFEEAQACGDPELMRDILTSPAMKQKFLSLCNHGLTKSALLILQEARKLEESLQLNSSSLVGDLLGQHDGVAFWYAASEKHPDTVQALLSETPDFLHEQAAFAIQVGIGLEDKELKKHELWQELGGGSYHWRAVTNADAPHESLVERSPYKFKPPLYHELLPIAKKACEIEGNTGAELHAYKLAVLFSNVEEADRYITKYATKWSQEGNAQIIHDACLFELPKVGVWDVNRWKDFVLKYGPSATKYLELAPRIDAFLEQSHRPFPKSPEELHTIVNTLISYKRGHERPDLAELCVQYGLSEERFEKALDVLQQQQKTKDNLPEIFLDGADFGYPNYYMSKLDISDPKGLILGEITNNCQSIGKNGEGPAIHGATSENGGFYVWKRKTKGRITEQDPIIAQSWAWLAPKGVLVFDSFERLDSVYNKIAQPFLEQFAYEVVHQNPHHYEALKRKKSYSQAITAIHLGTGGYTPENIHLPRAKPLASPLDYTGYRDSQPTPEKPDIGQYIVSPIDHKNIIDKTLPPPKDDRQLELAARNYIRRTLKKFEDRYGIKVRTGIELEFYAVGKDGQPTSQVLDIEKINEQLKNSPFVERFDHENTTDLKGQYEAVIGINPREGKVRTERHGDPLRAAMGAQAVRKHFIQHAVEHGLQRVEFDPLPFDEQEASGAHISFSLWDTEGNPLFECDKNHVSPFLSAIVHGALEIQRPTTILFAQNDKAYKRFGNTEWSPNLIHISTYGQNGASLRLANANDKAFLQKHHDPKDVRIENRLPSSDANYIIAMAGTIAGIDHALEKYVTVLPEGTAQDASIDMKQYETMHAGQKLLAVKKSDLGEFKTYMLPTSRLDAAEALKNGIQEQDLPSLFGNEFVSALLKQQQIEHTDVEHLR